MSKILWKVGMAFVLFLVIWLFIWPLVGKFLALVMFFFVVFAVFRMTTKRKSG